jgi:hypothetical protein
MTSGEFHKGHLQMGDQTLHFHHQTGKQSLRLMKVLFTLPSLFFYSEKIAFGISNLPFFSFYIRKHSKYLPWDKMNLILYIHHIHKPRATEYTQSSCTLDSYI